MNDNLIIEDYFDTKYNEANELYYETFECSGEDCSNRVEEEGELCNECKHLLQKCFSEWLSQFNEQEQEYLMEYIQSKEV